MARRKLAATLSMATLTRAFSLHEPTRVPFGDSVSSHARPPLTDSRVPPRWKVPRFWALLTTDPTGDETSRQPWSEFQFNGTIRRPFPQEWHARSQPVTARARPSTFPHYAGDSCGNCVFVTETVASNPVLNWWPVVAETCGILPLRSEQFPSALRRLSMIRNRQLPNPMINFGDA